MEQMEAVRHVKVRHLVVAAVSMDIVVAQRSTVGRHGAVRVNLGRVIARK